MVSTDAAVLYYGMSECMSYSSIRKYCRYLYSIVSSATVVKALFL